MKLSEAIRLGAMMKPQGKGYILNEGKTCALGAALDAIGYPISEKRRFLDMEVREIRESYFPVLAKQIEDSSTGIALRSSVESAIVMMNDKQGKSREQIADWVEMIEAAEEAAKAEEEAKKTDPASEASQPQESEQRHCPEYSQAETPVA